MYSGKLRQNARAAGTTLTSQQNNNQNNNNTTTPHSIVQLNNPNIQTHPNYINQSSTNSFITNNPNEKALSNSKISNGLINKN